MLSCATRLQEGATPPHKKRPTKGVVCPWRSQGRHRVPWRRRERETPVETWRCRVYVCRRVWVGVFVVAQQRDRDYVDAKIAPTQTPAGKGARPRGCDNVCVCVWSSRRGCVGFDEGLLREATNRQTQPDTQWIVTTRPLYHLHELVHIQVVCK